MSQPFPVQIDQLRKVYRVLIGAAGFDAAHPPDISGSPPPEKSAN